MVAGAAAGAALEGNQQQHEAEQDRRQLRRGNPVAQGEPGAVDAGGEGIDRKVGATVP